MSSIFSMDGFSKIRNCKNFRSVAVALAMFGFATSASTGWAQNHRSPKVIHDPNVIMTQAIDDLEEKPLDPRIEKMPQIQDHLEVIHHRSQLVVTKKRVTRIAISDPSILEAAPYSEKELSLIGLGLGSTTLTLWFEDDDDPLIYLVKTIPDPSLEERLRVDYGKLERKLAVLFPNSKVYLIPLSGKIVVKGEARDSEEAARILQIVRGEVINQDGSLGGPQAFAATGGGRGVGIGNRGAGLNGNDLGSSFIVNMLNVPGEFTVMMRVRIAELSRSQLRQMGINLNLLLNDGRHAISSALASGAGTLSGIFENGEVNVLIDALESNGTATVLSEPVLTVLSGHAASFLSGGEFAVPTIVGIGGAQGQTTTFRGFGTSLIVTPTVIDGDLIRMQIVPEFSAVDNGNAVGGIPGLNSRRVQTTVELREGQTIVIGGLLHRQRSTDVARVPLIGSIPLVGPLLFNNKQSTEDETELLVLVSPEIVRPMEPDEVPPVPGFYVTHPNDHELYKYAMTEGAPDLGVYQLAPYGNSHGFGENVGFTIHNPAPVGSQFTQMPGGNNMMPIPQGGNFNGGHQFQGAPVHNGYPMGNNPPTNPNQAPMIHNNQPVIQTSPVSNQGQPQYQNNQVYQPQANNAPQNNGTPNFAQKLFGKRNPIRTASQTRTVQPQYQGQPVLNNQIPVQTTGYQNHYQTPVHNTGHTLPRR